MYYRVAGRDPSANMAGGNTKTKQNKHVLDRELWPRGELSKAGMEQWEIRNCQDSGKLKARKDLSMVEMGLK